MNRIRQPDDKVHVKVVIIGDSGVGKTSIAQRFVDDTFHDNTSSSVGGEYDTEFKSTSSCFLAVLFNGQSSD
jgi:GTPase SAR1 family protein